MKPRTSGFCARAAPPRPRAAAPATPLSRPRRPMVNFWVMVLPPRWCRPEAAWEDGSKRYASRGLRARKDRFVGLLCRSRAVWPAPSTGPERRSIVCNFGELHSIWALKEQLLALAPILYAMTD